MTNPVSIYVDGKYIGVAKCEIDEHDGYDRYIYEDNTVVFFIQFYEMPLPGIFLSKILHNLVILDGTYKQTFTEAFVIAADPQSKTLSLNINKSNWTMIKNTWCNNAPMQKETPSKIKSSISSEEIMSESSEEITPEPVPETNKIPVPETNKIPVPETNKISESKSNTNKNELKDTAGIRYLEI